MTKNCAMCGTGGSGICPECAEAQVKRKAFLTAYRVIDAFEAFRNGSIPREAIEPEQTGEDAAIIRDRYTSLKWVMGFPEAARLAKAEFMMRVLEEEC